VPETQIRRSSASGFGDLRGVGLRLADNTFDAIATLRLTGSTATLLNCAVIIALSVDP